MPRVKMLKDLSKLLKVRKGVRPARVSTLLKRAAQGGQDLRMPVMGGTKFPTDDSKVGPQAMLDKSKNVADKGPAPSFKTLAPGPPTVPQVTGTQSSTMPKIGADMTVQNDPLVRYLKKSAAELKDNLEAMPKGEPESELASEDPTPMAMDSHDEALSGTYESLSGLFNAPKSTFRQKCKDKDRPASNAEKIVDKVLNRG